MGLITISLALSQIQDYTVARPQTQDSALHGVSVYSPDFANTC